MNNLEADIANKKNQVMRDIAAATLTSEIKLERPWCVSGQLNGTVHEFGAIGVTFVLAG